jgi:uncharacterized protein YukE
MARVVTSDEAVALIGKLQLDIGTVNEALEAMLRTGNELASPQVWEGTAANQFRDTEWAQTRTWATNSVTQLNELRTTIDTINQNIMSAGGGLG